MDDHRFDALVKMLSSGGSRRGILHTLGAGTLAALVGKIASVDDAEAKKKHRKNKKKKKCKGGTRKCNGKCIPVDNCCIDGDCAATEKCVGGECVVKRVECQNDDDCDAGEVCQNRVCVDDGNQAECQDAGDCAANESCIGGECRCIFPEKPCGDVCCASDEACVNGQCVVGQGTCAAGDDICAGDNITCNGNDNCTCATRLDDDEVRCVQFVNDSRTVCTCNNDFRCEQDFGAGTICIKGGASCPDCTLEELGRCATLCPGSI
jgi:hypothetical protein